VHRKAKVTRMFKSPDGHPNALEATEQGLWVGEQVTDNAYLLDWHTGEVLNKVATESSNTSGPAYGGGYLWMGANGRPQHARRRGVHGVMFADDSLWVTCFKWNVVARLDPETMKVQQKIPFHLSRPHGLAWDHDGRVLDIIRLEKGKGSRSARNGHSRRQVDLPRRGHRSSRLFLAAAPTAVISIESMHSGGKLR
jgi:hypothetical protein